MQINSPEVDFNIGYMETSLRIKDTRFDIPRGLEKKEYKQILKQTQEEIDRIRKRIQEIGPDDGLLLEMTIEDYSLKKKKLNAIIKSHQQWGEDSIQKAKSYPIDNLIDFDGGGFARCIWHQEKSGSMKYYPSNNKVHCFGCGKNGDSIDVYQKLNDVNLVEAIKKLS